MRYDIIDEQRKEFLERASLKLSTMLEDSVFDMPTQNLFIDWCLVQFPETDAYLISARVLSDFQRRISEDFEVCYSGNPREIETFIVTKDTPSHLFAESLYKHISLK